MCCFVSVSDAAVSSILEILEMSEDAPGPEPSPEPDDEFLPTVPGECRTDDDCCFTDFGVGCFFPRLSQGFMLCIAPTDQIVPNKVDGCLRH